MSKSMNKSNGTTSLLFLVGMAILPLCVWNQALDSGLNSRQLCLGIWTFVLITELFITQRQKLADSRLPLIGVTAMAWWIWGWVPHFSAISEPDSLNVQLRNGSLVGLFLLCLIGLRGGMIQRRHLQIGGLIFGGLTSLNALLQIITALNEGRFQQDVYAITGLFQHKNLLSGALLLSLPFAMLSGWSGEKKWERTTGLYLSLLILLELVLLRTRGAWLGLVSSALLLIPFAWFIGGPAKEILSKMKKWWPALLVVAAVLGFSLKSETSSSQLLNERNITHRFAYWENTLEMIQEHPLSGVGHANWRLHFPKHGLEKTDTQVMNGLAGIQRPHNDFLWILSEQGVIGLLLYLALLVMALWSVISNRGQTDPEKMGRLLICWFSFVAFCIFSFGDFPYERSGHMALFFILMALMTHEAADVRSLKLPILPLLLILGGVSVGSALIAKERTDGEMKTRRVLELNVRRDVRVIQAVKDAQSEHFVIDNFANPLPYYAALGELYNTKDLEAANRSLAEALECHPWHILSLNQLGNLHKTRKEWTEAEACFDRVLALSPQFEMARLNKAEMLIRKREWTEAFIWLHGCALHSQNSKLFQMAGMVLPRMIQERQSSGQKLTPLLRRLAPYANNRKQLVEQYRNFRRMKRQGATSP